MHITMRTGFPLLALAVLAVPHLRGADDDDEERAYQRLVAQRLVKENCLICHSQELIETQRLTEKQWKAEVDKMVGWGAPLDTGQQAALVGYLSAEYPVDAAPARLSVEAPTALLDAGAAVHQADEGRAGDPARGSVLYARDCANCHGADGQGAELGPNVVEKPVLYRRGDYDEVVRQGRGRMPGFAPVLDGAGQRDVLAWLRGRRYLPPAVPPK
jgi:mono/diheme cytochrome c family protein